MATTILMFYLSFLGLWILLIRPLLESMEWDLSRKEKLEANVAELRRQLKAKKERLGLRTSAFGGPRPDRSSKA